MCTFFSTFLQTLNLVIQVFQQLKPNQPNCQKLYMMKMLTISVSNKRHEAVTDVSRVVHSQTNSYHQVDAGHNVDREAPQVHDTSHIHLQKGDFNCYKKNCFQVSCMYLYKCLCLSWGRGISKRCRHIPTKFTKRSPQLKNITIIF